MIRDLRLFDVPTILGASTNPTPWELWNICAGRIEEPPRASAASDWRQLLKSAVLKGIEDRYRCKLHPMEVREPPHSCVRLFDLQTIVSAGDLPLSKPCDALILRQINADVLANVWRKDSRVEPPLAEIAKAQLYMHAYSLPNMALFVLASGGEAEALVELSYDETFALDIIARVNDFRQSILDNNEPSPDFKVDWKALEARYKPTVAGPPLDLRDRPDITEIKNAYAQLSSQKTANSRVGRELEAEEKAKKAQLKSILGNHASALLSDGSLITFKEVCIKEQVRAASSYQRLDITPAGANLN